jgi:hypothetical protein
MRQKMQRKEKKEDQQKQAEDFFVTANRGNIHRSSPETSGIIDQIVMDWLPLCAARPHPASEG